jgi:hypothetical protein
MFGAMNTDSSRDRAIMPARNQAIVSLMPYGRSLPSWCMIERSPAASQTLMWRWPDEPVQRWSGLDMNVMPQPLR